MEGVSVIQLVEVVAILVAVLFYIGTLVIRKFKPSIAEKFKPYIKPAMMAFEWVEKEIDDNTGTQAEDSKLEKMVHKGDLFLKKFLEISAVLEKPKPTKELIIEAESLASKLALARKNAEKSGAEK